MSFRNISELPIREARGGQVLEGSQGFVGNLNANVVLYPDTGEYLMFWKGGKGFNADQDNALMRGVWDPADFATITENEGVRSIDVSDLPTQTGGDKYIFHFDDGDGNVTGYGTAPFDATSGYGDFSVWVWDDEGTTTLVLGIYCSDNATLGNSIAIFWSTDAGMNWTFKGPAIAPGGGQYTNKPGGQFTYENELFMITSTGSNRKALRGSTDGGLTWTDYGRAIDTTRTGIEFGGSATHEPDYTSRPIGRSHVRGSRVFTFQPASQISDDWPKCQLCYWKNLADLRTDSLWNLTYFPVAATDPTAGGEWQFNVFDMGGHTYAAFNRWSRIGYQETHTPDMIIAQDTQYYTPFGGPAAEFMWKNIYVKRLTWDGLWTNPDYRLFVEEAWYRFRQNGLYLEVPERSGEPVGWSAEPTPRTRWRARLGHRHLGLYGDRADGIVHWLSSASVVDDIGVTTEYPDGIWRPNARAEASRPFNLFGLGFNPSWAADYNKHWIPLFVGDGATRRVVLANRRTRWILREGGVLGPDRGSERDVFEVLPG